MPLIKQLVDTIQISENKGWFCAAVGAADVTLARLDYHDVLAEGLSIVTAEADWHRPGLLGSAAVAIQTRPTVPGTEHLQAAAACVGELYRQASLFHGATLLTALLIWEEPE